MQVSEPLKAALSDQNFPPEEQHSAIVSLAKQYLLEKQDVTELVPLRQFKWLCRYGDDQLRESLFNALTTTELLWTESNFGEQLVYTRSQLLTLFSSGALNFQLYAHRLLVYKMLRYESDWKDEYKPIFEAMGNNLPGRVRDEVRGLSDSLVRGLMLAFFEDSNKAIYLRLSSKFLPENPEIQKQLVQAIKLIGVEKLTNLFEEEFDNLKLKTGEYIQLFVDAGVDPRVCMNRETQGNWDGLALQLRLLYFVCDVESIQPNPILKAYENFCEECHQPTLESTKSSLIMLILAENGCVVPYELLHPDVRDLNIPYSHKLLLSGFLGAPVPRGEESLFKEPEQRPSHRFGLLDVEDFWREAEHKRYRIPEILPTKLRAELLKTMLLEPTLQSNTMLYRAGMTTAFNTITSVYSMLMDAEGTRLTGEEISHFGIHVKQDPRKMLEFCRLMVNLKDSDLKPFKEYPILPQIKLIWAIFAKKPEEAQGCGKEYIKLNCEPRILEATQNCAVPWDMHTMNLIQKWEQNYTGTSPLPDFNSIWKTHFSHIGEEVFLPWYVAMSFLGLANPEQQISLFLFLLNENYDINILYTYFNSAAECYLKDEWMRITGKKEIIYFSKFIHLAALKPLLAKIPDNQCNDGEDDSLLNFIGRVAMLIGPDPLTTDIVKDSLTKDDALAISIGKLLLPHVQNERERWHLLRFCRVEFLGQIKTWLKDPITKSPDPLGMLGWSENDQIHTEMIAKYKEWEKLQVVSNLINLDFIWQRDHSHWSPTPLPFWYCQIRSHELESLPHSLKSFETYHLFGEEGWREIFCFNKKPLCLVREWFKQPKKFGRTIGEAVYTENVGIQFNGRHQHTGLRVMRTVITDKVLKHTEEINEAGKRIRLVLNSREGHEDLPFSKPEKLPKLTSLKEQIEKMSLLGRSYVLKEGQEIHVHKISRSNESTIKEPAVLAQLTEEKVLKSTLPQPLTYVRVDRLSRTIFQPIEEQGIMVNASRSHVYTYKASIDYIRYINGADVTDAEFEAGHQAFVYDAILILRDYKLILNVADLFHNNEQGRRLLVMRDLFMRKNLHNPNFITTGLGRIDNVPAAVRYPNARVTGLADYADATTHEEIQRWPYDWASDLDGVQCTWEPIANGIAEVLLTDLLLALTRLDAQGRLDWSNKQIQELMIKWAQESCSNTLLAYTKRPGEECIAFVRDCDFDWLGYVQESMFWYQNNAGGYLGALRNGVVPECILPKKGVMTYKLATSAPNFRFKLGASNDGVNKDIGLFNATAGLTRFELLVYRLTMVALSVAEVDFIEKLEVPNK